MNRPHNRNILDDTTSLTLHLAIFFKPSKTKIQTRQCFYKPYTLLFDFRKSHEQQLNRQSAELKLQVNTFSNWNPYYKKSKV